MIKHMFLATLLLPFPLLSAANSCANIPMEFYDAYALTTDQDDEALSAYITVKNRDPIQSHTISDVSSPGARAVFFQSYARNSENDDRVSGVTDQIVIPPGGVYQFRPEHTHIVMTGYKYRPNPDDMISLTFTFADDCTQTINNVPVQNPDN